MSKNLKTAIIACVFAAAVAMIVFKNVSTPRKSPVADSNLPAPVLVSDTNAAAAPGPNSPAEVKPLASLIELGSHQCIPCKQMMIVLDELRSICGPRLAIEFIDVRENPAAAEKYKIEVIPVQVFLDASGKEIFRHEGYFPTQDILDKFKELGIELSK